MSDIILHHYAFSTFSEKIRVALGYKGLSYHSVDIPGLPPRPYLEPLTGGYRRAPVMQMGADVYCDTNLILSTIERLHPTPSLSPSAGAGLAQGLGFAWERQLWIPTIGVLVHYIGEHIPPEFIKDRKEGYLGIDISKSAMAPQFQEHLQFVRAQVAWLNRALADGRAYLFGAQPSMADLACWQTIFLLRKNCPPDVDGLVGFSRALIAWYERINAFGHGKPTAMTPEDAHTVAKNAQPSASTHLQPNGDPGGLKVGARVTITPDDNAKVPVTGDLVGASESEIVIHRNDPGAGHIHIHFPRLGYIVTNA
jgi:glutathione S-transferase